MTCQTNHPIKVLCVDDSPDICVLLTIAIKAEPDMTPVGALSDADELLGHISRTRPDVVLIDLGIPGCDVLALIQQMRDNHANVRTIVFSGHTSSESIDAAIEAGAWGYVFKNCELSQVINAIRKVAGGEVSLVC